MKKVTIEGERGYYRIVVDGSQVGQISGCKGDYWVMTGTGVVGAKFIARFKYFNSLSSAKHFVKWAFARFDAEVMVAMSSERPPLVWAGDHGYVCYNVLKARKKAV